jgi:hypothetical protein
MNTFQLDDFTLPSGNHVCIWFSSYATQADLKELASWLLTHSDSDVNQFGQARLCDSIDPICQVCVIRDKDGLYVTPVGDVDWVQALKRSGLYLEFEDGRKLRIEILGLGPDRFRILTNE